MRWCGWMARCLRTGSRRTVVTNEQSAPESRKEVKLPDVCDQFGVRRDHTFTMLRSLSIQFDWTGSG